MKNKMEAKVKVGLDITSTGKPTITFNSEIDVSAETKERLDEQIELRVNEILDRIQTPLVNKWIALSGNLSNARG